MFDTYIDALAAAGRKDDMVSMISLFAPHWGHNLGYGTLGTAAFKAGQRDVAERYFVQLREGLKDYHRSEEMSLLAEIWHARGDTDRARDLLIDCMNGLVTRIKESKYNSDRKMYADNFQHHRSTYLRLFSNGQAELQKLGIPDSPL